MPPEGLTKESAQRMLGGQEEIPGQYDPLANQALLEQCRLTEPVGPQQIERADEDASTNMMAPPNLVRLAY